MMKFVAFRGLTVGKSSDLEEVPLIVSCLAFLSNVSCSFSVPVRPAMPYTFENILLRYQVNSLMLLGNSCYSLVIKTGKCTSADGWISQSVRTAK